MSIATEDLDRWLVSTRANGEVLTTRASVPGLELRLLGRVEGFAPAEVESWLASLARSVRESVHETPAGDPVPPMLREALGGLLFSHAELWSRGEAPCSIVLVASPERIAFGWVGEASVDVVPGGGYEEGEWISVRDAQGREARAWCGSPRGDARIDLAWTDPRGGVVRVEALWTAAEPGDPRSSAAATLTEAPRPEVGRSAILAPSDVAGMTPDHSTAPAAAETSPPEAIAADAVAAERQEWMEAEQAETVAGVPAPQATREIDPPSAGIARWLEQHLQWNTVPSPAARAAPMEESGDETRGVDAAPDASELQRASEVEGASAPQPLLPTAPEERGVPEGTGLAEVEAIPAHEPESMPLEVPERIPPTPEPEALTARAVDVSPGRSAAPEAEAQPRRARRPEWPAEVETERARKPRNWKPALVWGAVVLALFGAGWMLGSFQNPEGPEEARRPSAFILFLRQVGLAPPRFQVQVVSRPEGGWIAVDGKDLLLRAPATLELAPGEHRVELSFPDLGSAAYLVKGAKNDKVVVDAPLWGSIDVVPSDAASVVSVSLDGQAVGFVPLRIDSVAPGPHELRFSGPGMASWGSTVEVRVGETREVLAYPLQSPATGLLQVRATQSEEGETAPVAGARVWVDAVARGVTPLTLALPRGPHSVRVVYQQEEAPIQVIDLPGGNQRFATFEFGLRSDFPTLALKAPAAMTVEEPALISATLSDVSASDLREMWLHVRSEEGRWRRYPMTLMDAQGSVVGAAPFPVSLLGADGKQLYYVSAVTSQGDEYFTEMQTARGPARGR